jgi:beta-glucosidase/6-phospho-beta-glucosidase/beta-galactosidase
MDNRNRLLVTLEGYAVEGGFDRVGEPMTCYSPTIALGRHAGPGNADGLWRNYETVLDFVPALGVDGVRLTLEWARIEPRRGMVDEAVLARYGEVIRYARGLDLDVTIAIIDAVWPSWLGLEAWILPWTVPYVLDHARRMVETFSEWATGFLAFTQSNELVTRGFLTGKAPPWRESALNDAAFAHAQIERIFSSLREDELVGRRLVPSSAVTTLDVAAEDLSEARRSHDVAEIYVRSLLRGAGPTSVAQGLLVQHGSEWRINASEELLSAFR